MGPFVKAVLGISLNQNHVVNAENYLIICLGLNDLDLINRFVLNVPELIMAAARCVGVRGDYIRHQMVGDCAKSVWSWAISLVPHVEV